MERNDIIKTRDDVIANVRTLYSYLSGVEGEGSKAWAIDKMKRGKNFVVEIIDDRICFAPSRFVGYVNNTIDKHEENHGDGTQTDDLMPQFYTKVSDERLDRVFQEAIEPFGIRTGSKKYWIPLGMTVEDILSKKATLTIIKIMHGAIPQFLISHFPRRTRPRFYAQEAFSQNFFPSPIELFGIM